MNDGPQAPGNVCPACGTGLDGATNLKDEELIPTPGDLSVCAYCGEILEFDENLKSKILGTEALFELPDDIRLEIMRYHRAVIQRIEEKNE